VTATVALGAGAAAVVAATATTAHAATATGASAPAAGVATSAGAAKAGALAGAGLTAKAAPWIVLAFVAGGGAGAAVHSAATPRPAPVIAPSSAYVPPVPTTAQTSLPVMVPSSVPSAEPSAAPSARPTTTAITRPGANTPSSDVDLAAERALIDRARMALARRQSGPALAALDEHTSRFPRGRLAEEREALAIQALAQAGRGAEAQRRADAFRRAYPKSVFLPAVDLASGAP
jgi:hypothetical protein